MAFRVPEDQAKRNSFSPPPWGPAWNGSLPHFTGFMLCINYHSAVQHRLHHCFSISDRWSHGQHFCCKPKLNSPYMWGQWPCHQFVVFMMLLEKGRWDHFLGKPDSVEPQKVCVWDRNSFFLVGVGMLFQEPELLGPSPSPPEPFMCKASELQMAQKTRGWDHVTQVLRQQSSLSHIGMPLLPFELWSRDTFFKQIGYWRD